jgi:peptide/nickel transport system permease protein
MNPYLSYLAKRLVQFLVVVFVGMNITYLITHLTPINPVEQTISAATAFGNTSPEAIELMRSSLRQLYGLEGGVFEQYVTFWKRAISAPRSRLSRRRSRR